MLDKKYMILLKQYSEYISSEESIAVFLVRYYVDKLDTKTKWIDVVSSDYWDHKSGLTGFNYLIVEIFDRKVQPIYPKKTDDMDDFEYKRICKAITWEVSHQDIHDQRTKGIRGPMYLLTVSIYNKNRGKKIIEMKPFWNEEYGGFDHTGKVPTTEKAVEKDMEPEWIYRVSDPRQITDADDERIRKYFYNYIYDKIQAERRVDLEWYFVEYEPKIKKPEKQNMIKKKPEPKKPITKEQKKVVDSPKKYWQ